MGVTRVPRNWLVTSLSCCSLTPMVIKNIFHANTARVNKIKYYYARLNIRVSKAFSVRGCSIQGICKHEHGYMVFMQCVHTLWPPCFVFSSSSLGFVCMAPCFFSLGRFLISLATSIFCFFFAPSLPPFFAFFIVSSEEGTEWKQKQCLYFGNEPRLVEIRGRGRMEDR